MTYISRSPESFINEDEVVNTNDWEKLFSTQIYGASAFILIEGVIAITGRLIDVVTVEIT